MLKGKINRDGNELEYRIEGSGIPSLVIGSSVFYPRVFSEQIREHLQLIFIDHRGFVEPPKRKIAESEYTLNTIVEDIEKVRKQLKLESFLMIGHSGHAFMALEYSKKYPQHVLGTVMIAVSPDYSEQTHQRTEDFFTKTASQERKDYYYEKMALLPKLIEENPDQRFVSFCLCNGARNWYQHDFDASGLWEGVYTNMLVIDHVWGMEFRDIDIKKGLKELKKPVWVALGSHDYVTGPPELWNDIRQEFKDVQLTIFEKSAHYPSYEESEAFDEKMLSWLQLKL